MFFQKKVVERTDKKEREREEKGQRMKRKVVCCG